VYLMEILISVENLTKKFNREMVLHSLVLHIYKGEIIGIVGGSGTGKTTLLKTLVGELAADAGMVIYHFKERVKVTALTGKSAFYSIIGFSPQESSFYDHLTVEENLFFYSRLYGLSGGQNTRNLLFWVNLYNKKATRAKDLSGGMQRRLDIACALVHHPRILFLDEPVAHLDPINRKQIWALISKLNHAGTTIVMTSNFEEEIRPICTRMVCLKNGQIENDEKNLEINRERL